MVLRISFTDVVKLAVVVIGNVKIITVRVFTETFRVFTETPRVYTGSLLISSIL